MKLTFRQQKKYYKKSKFQIIFLVLIITSSLSCSSSKYKILNNEYKWVTKDLSGEYIRVLEKHNIETFYIFKNPNYARDENSVFYQGIKIKDADPNTFIPIKKTGYSKDSNSVFLETDKVVLAQPKSFELLEFPYSKDNNNIFCGTIPLKLNIKEVDEFEVTNTNELGSKRSSILSAFIQRNPDYEWLDTTGVSGVIYGDRGTGRTKHKEFKAFREIQN